jgi:uncharacterized membrane protein
MTTEKLIYIGVGIVVGVFSPAIIGWILDAADTIETRWKRG